MLRFSGRFRNIRRGHRLWGPTRLGVVGALIGAGALVVVFARPAPTAATATKVSGSVNVLYCGSFLDLMQQQIAPAFHEATGYSVTGFSAGSTSLASEIRGGIQVADVFISASPSVNATLEGAANGNWVSSYDEFGRSPLVLGYNPSSKFAKLLRDKPWYEVVNRKGFLLGRTDPAVDPKGMLAADALKEAAIIHHEPSLAKLASQTSGVFTETALIGELQSGQLDAGFFYGVEAAAAHLKTVPLTGTRLAAFFTVAILNRAPHEEAAKAFVHFLLSAKGQQILKKNDVSPLSPIKVFRRPFATAATNVASTSTSTSTSQP